MGVKINKRYECWEQLYPSGTPPPPRVVSHIIYHPTRNSLILFGGTGDYVWYNDLWELKLDSMVWREITVTGTRPSPRGAGGKFFDETNNRMIIFGGRSDVFYNDLWALDLTPGNEHWTQLYPSGAVPSGRSDFSYGYDPKRNKFYVFAGWNYPPLTMYNDLYVLDISTLTWTQLYPSGEPPAERRAPTGVYDYLYDNFFVFGGDCGLEAYSAETFYINFATPDVPEWQAKPIVNIAPSIVVNTVSSDLVRIRYTMPKICKIEIKILDANGRVIKNLFTGLINSTTGALVWNTNNNNGEKISSGVYYCLLETEDTKISKKFVIAK